LSFRELEWNRWGQLPETETKTENEDEAQNAHRQQDSNLFRDEDNSTYQLSPFEGHDTRSLTPGFNHDGTPHKPSLGNPHSFDENFNMNNQTPSPVINLQGASQTEGGIFQGRALGNVFNIADALDLGTDHADTWAPITGKVLLYTSHTAGAPPKLSIKVRHCQHSV
jgi:hypothetical protein